MVVILSSTCLKVRTPNTNNFCSSRLAKRMFKKMDCWFLQDLNQQNQHKDTVIPIFITMDITVLAAMRPSACCDLIAQEIPSFEQSINAPKILFTFHAKLYFLGERDIARGLVLNRYNF